MEANENTEMYEIYLIDSKKELRGTITEIVIQKIITLNSPLLKYSAESELNYCCSESVT